MSPASLSSLSPFLCFFSFPRTDATHGHLPEFVVEPAVLEPALPEVRGTAWEEDETSRPAALAKAILARAEEFDGTIIITHGGVAHRLALALSGKDAGGVGYAAWCELALPPSAQQAGADDTTITTAELVRPFSLPLDLTPSTMWAKGFLKWWLKWFGPDGARLGMDKPVRVLELRSWEGMSTCFWLCNLAQHHAGSRVISVDHFDDMATSAGQERRRKFLANVRVTGHSHKHRLLPHFTLRALSQLLLAEPDETELHQDKIQVGAADAASLVGSGFDLVYVDASHTAIDTLMDGLLAWRLLKQGGYMLFDDYDWPTHSAEYPHNPPSKNHPDHPAPGIDAFLSLVSHELTVISKSYQVLVKKTAVGPHRGIPLPSRHTLPVGLTIDAETQIHALAGLALLVEAAQKQQLQLEVLLLDLGDTDRESAEKALSAVPMTWMAARLDGYGRDMIGRRRHAALHMAEFLPGRFSHVLQLLSEVRQEALLEKPAQALAFVELWRRRPVEAAVAVSAAAPGAAVIQPVKLAPFVKELGLRHELLLPKEAQTWRALMQEVLAPHQLWLEI